MPEASQLEELSAVAAGDLLVVADVSAGQSKSITSQNFMRSLPGVILPGNIDISVADQTARDALTPFEGMLIYRKDTDAIEIYDGSAWLTFDTKWQTYTPTLTNLTLGSGTSVGKYKRSGKDCEIDYVFTLGAGSAVGSNPEVTLPFNRVASGYGTDFLQPAIGNAVIVDEASAAYPGSVTTSQTKFRMYAHTASGTYTTLAAITATVPITFGSTDQLGARFKYQMA